MKSWLHIPADSDFSLYNIPFGIFRTSKKSARAGTRIGDHVIDLYELTLEGVLSLNGLKIDVLKKDTLNDFIGLGKSVTNPVRERLIQLFKEGNEEIQEQDHLLDKILIDASEVEMLMPVHVGDYTDFYSSLYHATNVGSMFRPDNPLLPNWKHLPVAYHGRASSIVVSGTPVKRPKGQFMSTDSETPTFGPSNALDFELELAYIIGKNTDIGSSVEVKDAESHIFGFVLFNDWSARDIQSWEYQPLGPFLSKNFQSSVSPWIVTTEALLPFKVAGPTQDPEVLPYLKTDDACNYDIELSVYLKPEGSDSYKIVDSNFKHMYWNVNQQLAHHTISGCNMRVGDMLASGTISGPEKSSRGCLLELTWRGKDPIKMPDGTERKYLKDGDTIIMKGFSQKSGMKVGFGEVSGKIIP
jgi:fumarylacetoacetase